jgi:hypothetical protein
MKLRDNTKDLVRNGRKISKCVLGKYGCRVWIGFIWLRIETDGRLL